MEELSNLKGHKKAFVVTGGHSMQKFGFLDKLTDILKKAGMEVKVHAGVKPDPSVEEVYDGAKAMREFQPDVIVAIGGGSPIDAAKAMWIFYEYPDKKFDDVKDPFSLPKLRQKAIFVAIPSTSGTATEVTAFSVITDYSNKVKYPLADFEITPDVAVLDYALAETMPKTLTAHTGMDALTHALEAYVAVARSPFSDALAIKAISMIVDNIVDSYNGNKKARERMHVAQCLAGMAFSNALLGICHSLAHKIGAQFDLAHGLCNAILLPYVIKYNSVVSMKDYADVSRSLGLPGNTDKQLTHSLIGLVQDLNNRLSIQPTLKTNGVTDELFNQHIDFIAEQAQLDPCTGANPRGTTPTELKKILQCALDGTPLNF